MKHVVVVLSGSGFRPKRREESELRRHPLLHGRPVQELLRERVPLILHQPAEEGGCTAPSHSVPLIIPSHRTVYRPVTFRPVRVLDFDRGLRGQKNNKTK